MRPLIGITTADFSREFGKPYHGAYARNAWAIADAGGLPVYIPTGLAEDVLRELYERLDAVLLPGGPDVDPSYYGQERHPETKVIDDARDTLELTLARWTYEDDRPLFGICRGHQVMNVAFGGTLVQDIPSIVDTKLSHDTPDQLPRNTIQHEVEISPNSRLASIVGSTHVAVNSLHHQSVERPAPGITITGYSPDGVIESLEAPDKRFVLSVQWHPEDLYATDASMKQLFESFIEAARESAALKQQTH
ncbi:MAG TPA: gamma-glutamyl-gamma-aminobutyrate hydrolase family protein [Phototrophicaceae bacterium]|nr:gamma-glutamyl-gamma-aminobutyrate hydrolase family protein [Phototrophicaceae bacterium]